MRPVNIKSINYRDTLARDRRRRFIFKLSLVFIVLLVITGGMVYLFFFSKAFDIRDISMDGLKTVDSNFVMAEVRAVLESKKFKYLEPQKDILFFNSEPLKVKLLNEFAILSDIKVEKKFWHGLVFNFTERTATGIWCFSDGHCHYFDDSGVLWGDAIKSSGFLYLTVDDLRKQSGNETKIDTQFFKGIKMAIEKLKNNNLIVKEATIPENSIEDFNLLTSGGYNLMFNLGTDIGNQVDVLKIFLNDKSKDSNFMPQYIDLRIDGRVYYK